MKRKKTIVGTIICIAICLTLFAALEWWAEHAYKPVAFKDKLLQSIRRNNPDIICIGNSVLGTNVDHAFLQKTISEVTGRRRSIRFVIGRSLHTAWQYLVLKNQVLPVLNADTPIFIFDYEDYFTRPDAGTSLEGPNENEYKTNMLGKEKVFRGKIGGSSLHFLSGFPYLYSQREKINKTITATAIRYLLDKSHVSRLVRLKNFRPKNERSLELLFHSVYKGSNFRNGFADDMERVDRPLIAGNSYEEFVKNADQSFLPDILALKGSHPIIFVLSNSNPAMKRIKQSLTLYSARLKQYLSQHGAYLIDLNKFKELQSPRLMKDSRHFKPGEPVDINTQTLAQQILSTLKEVRQQHPKA